MVTSRLRRVEERNAARRIGVAIIGTFGLLVFMAIFGLRILVGFSLLVDKIRGSSPQLQQDSLLLPPILNPLPEATNSATINVQGKGNPKLQLILYVNDAEYKKVTLSDTGVFEVSDIRIDEGQVTISAKQSDDKNNISDLSNVISTLIDRTAPKLTIDKPEDNARVNDGTHKVAVSGITDEDMKVTINGRIVVLKSDGSFTYSTPLNDGENKLEIISRDPAGNETKMERLVTYVP